MPKATTTGQETERFELKTLPALDGDEAGFVVIRRMTYGEYLERRAMTGGMKVEGKKGQGLQGMMQLINTKVTEYEFKNCIVDHNLTDDNGDPLDFRKPHTLRVLDPRVGEEISTLIGKVNNFEDEDEEDLGN